MKKLILLGLVLILLSSLVSAVWVEENQAEVYGASDGRTSDCGYNATITGVVGTEYNVAFTKTATHTATKAYIINSYDGTVYGTVNFVGNLANFTGVYNITANTPFIVTTDNNGVAYIRKRHDGAPVFPFPYVLGDYTLLNAVYQSRIWGTVLSNTINKWALEDFWYEEIIIPPKFILTLKNTFNSTSILEFKADIINASGTTTISTTNGSIMYLKDQIVNISVYNISSNTYFNRSILEQNTSIDLETNAWQSVLYIYAQNNDTLTQIDNFNFTLVNVSSQFNKSVNKFTTFLLNANSFNYTGKAEAYMDNSSGSITLSSLQTRNITVNFTRDTQNKLWFFDINTSNPIENATVTVTYPNAIIENLITNSSGAVNFSFIKSGSEIFGNYTILFQEQGFIGSSFITDINTSNAPINQSYNISRANININIYDRETNQLLTNLVEIIMLSVLNTTTTTGIKEISNLSIVSSEHTIQVVSLGYKTEIKSFDYSNQENITLNFYLLNLTGPNTGTLIVTNTDEYFRVVVNAKDVLLEYDETEKTFIEVSQCISNKNGECIFSVELNKKLYIVRGRAIIGGVEYFDSTREDGQLILEDNYIIPLYLLISERFSSMQIGQTVIDNISQDFNENTNISDINVSFYTLDDLLATICVEYERVFGNEVTSLITYCSSSSDGQISGPPVLLNRNYNHRARIYQIIDDIEFPIRSYYYTSINSALQILDNLVLLDFLLLGLILGLIIISFWSKNITWLWPVFGILSWILAGKSLITVRGAFMVTAICIFAFPISRKQLDTT